ncbi:hypothetical protein K144316041_p20510 (plasmid) [Clostridium tetani]|uniref:hypothetical protein n=1 Tax=Clostridium tetani TaxID=1513 RepID=UPI002954AD83|nr:hypothetical protein [Clostridium tetani]BDR74212.1 hypothetical protein K144316041_p20510 [Clostridium tetani]
MNRYKQALNNLLNEIYINLENYSYDNYNQSTYDCSKGYIKGQWDIYELIKNKINKLEG